MTIAIAKTGGVLSYATAFPTVENPLSDSGAWTNGGATGLDWNNVKVVAAGAQGVQNTTSYADCLACLNAGSWGGAQKATAVFHRSGTQAVTSEAELLLHFSIAANSAQGYEFLYDGATGGNAYFKIVRWDGTLGNFTILSSVYPGFSLADGDSLEARRSGNALLLYVNGRLVTMAIDTTYSA